MAGNKGILESLTKNRQRRNKKYSQFCLFLSGWRDIFFNT